MKKETEMACRESNAPSCFFCSLFFVEKLAETVGAWRAKQQHSHMPHGPLRDKRRGRSRTVKHHRKKKERESVVGRTACRDILCVREDALSKKGKKKKKKKAAAALSPLLTTPFKETFLSCFLFVVLSPW
jgi:hypothetical protein